MNADLAVYVIKYVATTATAVLGLVGLYGDTHETRDGRTALNKRGRSIRKWILVSLVAGILAVYFENQLDRQKEKDQQLRYTENLTKQDSILSYLSSVSDSMMRLRALSETTVTSQTSVLKRTSSLVTAMQENSRAQALLLKQQRQVAVDAQRVLYRFDSPKVTLTLNYEIEDASDMRLYADDVYTKATAVLREAGNLLRNPPRNLRSGPRGFYVPYIMVDTVHRFTALERLRAVIFGDVPRQGKALRIDSVALSSGSDWLTAYGLGPQGNPITMSDPNPTISISRDRSSLSGNEPLDMVLYTRSPGDSGRYLEGQFRYSVVDLVIDYPHGVIRQTLTCTDVTQFSAGRINSILDLPGATIFVNVDQRADSLISLVLQTNGGLGREVRVPPSGFDKMGWSLLQSIDGQDTLRWRYASHRFTISDIELYPNEFADLFGVSQDSTK